MNMKTIYTTTMTNTGGRHGTAVSPDGSLKFQMAVPAQMGGEGAEGTNPEQLFAAAYSSCFGGALELVLSQAHAEYETATVQADVSLVEDPADKGWMLAATITVSIKGLSLEQAEKYARLANKVCPYSKATKGNIAVEVKVA
jgi:Ohr subfamily peroxiredoxin